MLTTWEARELLEKNHLAKLEEIRNNNLKKKSYYIHFIPNWTGNGLTELKNTYILRSTKPPKMLGAALYFVDNEKEKFECLYGLPMDVDVDPQFLDHDNFVPEVAINAQNMRSFIHMS